MKLCLSCMEQYEDEKKVCPHCGYAEGTAQENALHMTPGSILADRYIVGKVIGYGGFGVTYIAWDTLLETKIAIKEYLPSEFSTRVVGQTEVTVFSGMKGELFHKGISKFIEEARNLAKFNSISGIVSIFDCIEANNTAYITMQMLEGETLSRRLEREQKLPEDEAVSIMLPVIQALETVHKEGILHRDIAPDNIFLTNDGGVKLIDFGAARYAVTPTDESRTVIIKPGYSPEEQYRSRGEQGTYTDVYSVGATLYKMITGQTVPDAMERRANYENTKKDLLKAPSSLVKGISQNRETAIMNALNIRIEDRTQTMTELYAELTSEKKVERKGTTIKKTDTFKWPLWAKIGIPSAAGLLIVFIVLFATGVIGFNANEKKDIKIPKGQTRVPSVVNNEIDEGKEKLEDAFLYMKIDNKSPSKEIIRNKILKQDTQGGSIVDKNSIVGVTISAGLSEQTMQNVEGMDADKAKWTVEGLGMELEIKEEYSSVIAAGCVINQSEGSGKKIPEGEKVTLVVSKGRDPEDEHTAETVIVDDYTGMTYEEALEQAEKQGFNVKVTNHMTSDEYEEGTVIDQNLAPDWEESTDQTLELVVSKGNAPVEVPDVLYRTETDAVAMLEAYGFTVNIRYEISDNVARGVVQAQEPEAGTEAEQGAVVYIVVSKGTPFEDVELLSLKRDELPVASIAAGEFFTVALKSDGTVVAVGENSCGQCDVSGWTDIVAVDTGWYHTVGLKRNGTVVAVGNNNEGECNVSGWRNIVSIAVGAYHTVGVRADGTVVAVGDDGYGRCDVSDWTDIVAAAAGVGHTVGLRSDGTVVAVGDNEFGQCDVSDWTDIVAIAAEYEHTVGLRADGTVVAVGGNDSGQCNVEGWTDIVAVTAGCFGTAGLRSDGTVVSTDGVLECYDPNMFNNDKDKPSEENGIYSPDIFGAENEPLVFKPVNNIIEDEPFYEEDYVYDEEWDNNDALDVDIDDDWYDDNDTWDDYGDPYLGDDVAAWEDPDWYYDPDEPLDPDPNDWSKLDPDPNDWSKDEDGWYGDYEPGEDEGDIPIYVGTGDLEIQGQLWTGIVEIAAGDHHYVGLRNDGTVVAIGMAGWTGESGQCKVYDWSDIETRRIGVNLDSFVPDDEPTGGDDSSEPDKEIEKSGQLGDNVFYTLDEDGVLYITGTGEMYDYSTTFSPFDSRELIQEVIISDEVTNIGDALFFDCSNLTSITIPNSVTSIGEHAFSHCDSLTSISIPNGVTHIKDNAFFDCYNLTDITIPSSVFDIWYAVFYSCNNLKSINVDSNNKNYCSVDGVLYDKAKTELICCPAQKTSITIPNSVEMIGDLAFGHCENLTSISIPNSVTYIGEYAFSDCYSLTSITIPKSVTNFAYDAFHNCPELTIKCYSGSDAETYAKSEGYKYQLIG